MPRTVRQLAWLGIEPQLLMRIEPYVTLLPEATQVNINTASAEVLYASDEDLDWAGASQLVQLRDSTPSNRWRQPHRSGALERAGQERAHRHHLLLRSPRTLAAWGQYTEPALTNTTQGHDRHHAVAGAGRLGNARNRTALTLYCHIALIECSIPPMSNLLIQLPAEYTSAGGEYSYVLSSDGQHIQRSGQAAASLLPGSGRASQITAVIPAARLSWHAVSLPPGLQLRSRRHQQRVRAVLDGLLEEKLLDDSSQLHLALDADAEAGQTSWVATCDKAWLQAHLQALEAAGHAVSIAPAMACQHATAAAVR